MTEMEKMIAGEMYCFEDEEIMLAINEAHRKSDILNSTPTTDREAYSKALRDLIPDAAPSAMIIPPFFCDLGFRITLGERVFINTRCTMLDSGGIRIGKNTKIGPDCKFYTPQHPFDFEERRKPIERGLGIEIGEDCWLGGGVTVVPGVKIGDRTIIGAGSVVVHDIPSDVMAAGNPAVVKKTLR